MARYRREGEAVFEPRSRRPWTDPNVTPAEVVDLLVRPREELTDQGLDAGPETICWHPAHHHDNTEARATAARHLTARGLIHLELTGTIVLTEFRTAVATHGIPASTLTDNGMVVTPRLSGGKAP